MTIISLLLLVIIIGWLALITVWRLQGRSAIVSLIAEAKDLNSKHSSLLNSIYFVITFIALVGLSVTVISQIGGRQSFFEEESYNNGENIIAYYDFLVGLPLSVVTSFIAILLAWNALRISTQQQKAEEFSLLKELFDDRKQEFGILLKDFEKLSKDTQDTLENLTSAAMESADYPKAKRLTSLDLGSLLVLSNTNSVDEFYRLLETKKINSPKWNEFIHQKLHADDDNFWYDKLDKLGYKIWNILVEFINTSERYPYDIKDAVNEKKISLLTRINDLFEHEVVTSGGVNKELVVQQVADGQFMDDDDYTALFHPDFLDDSELLEPVTLTEKLYTVSLTDRLFWCNDYDSEIYEEDVPDAHGEPTTVYIYQRIKIIRISGFDRYILFKKLITAETVQRYNTLIQRYLIFDLIFSEWFSEMGRGTETGVIKIATEVLMEKRKELRRQVFPHVKKMAVTGYVAIFRKQYFD